MTKNIFDIVASKPKVEIGYPKFDFFKFRTIGDSIQGTLIDVSAAYSDEYGQSQFLYTLITENGIVNVPLSTSSKITTEKLFGVRLGQVIGFRFESTYKAKVGTGKNIFVYEDKDVVDDTFVKENPELSKMTLMEYFTQGRTNDGVAMSTALKTEYDKATVEAGYPELPTDFSKRIFIPDNFKAYLDTPISTPKEIQQPEDEPLVAETETVETEIDYSIDPTVDDYSGSENFKTLVRNALNKEIVDIDDNYTTTLSKMEKFVGMKYSPDKFTTFLIKIAE